MSTSALLRNYQVKHLGSKELITIVIRDLSKELKEEFNIENTDENHYKISLYNYEVIISDRLINGLNKPYGIDRYILEAFKEQGFDFSLKKSQYILDCFANYKEFQ